MREDGLAASGRPSTDRIGGLARQGLAFAAFLALSLFYLRPIWRVFETHLAPDPGDPLFNLVILKWGVHSLHGPLSEFWATLWNAPFFFPARAVTTLSDHLLGPAAFAAVASRFGLAELASYNLLLLGSFVLSGFSAYWVLRQAGRSEAAAFLGGMAFAFAPFRWDQASHLQVLLTPWIPLVLWHFDRLLVKATGRRAGGFLLFYALHVSGGAYLAYMVHVALAVLLVNRLVGPHRIEWTRARIRTLALAGSAALALFAIVFSPYVAARDEIRRQGSDARQYGASLVTFVTPAVPNLYSGAFPPSWRRPENSYFPGFLPAALALFAIVAERRRARSAPRTAQSLGRRLGLGALLGTAAVAFGISEVRTWLAAPQVRAAGLEVSTLPYKTAFVVVLLALLAHAVLRRRWLGRRPPLFEAGWERGLVYAGMACTLFAFPFAYVSLMKVLPGFSGMRVESRFLVIAAFPVAALAARGFDLALERLRTRRPGAGARDRILIVGAAIAFLATELCPRPVPWNDLPSAREFPPVYRYLERSPRVAAVLELPIGSPLADLPYLYYGTLHHKPLVNGYSGFVPPENQAFRASCCWPVPDAERLALLRSWGVTHVVIHMDRLEGRWQRRAARHWHRSAPVRRVYTDETTLVYAIRPTPTLRVRAATMPRP